MSGKNIVDYSGRAVDLLLLKTVLAAPVVNKRVRLDVSDVPMSVAGVEKLVQRYALLFLTKFGSCHVDEGEGTRFVSRVQYGFVYDMPSLTAAAAEANLWTMTQVREGDAGLDTPQDERLVKSDVVDLKFSREKAEVMVSVRLTTEAGSSYDYIIPVAIGVH